MIRSPKSKALWIAAVGMSIMIAVITMQSSHDSAKSQQSLPPGKQEFLAKEQAALEANSQSKIRPFDPSDPSTWPDWFTLEPAAEVHGDPAGAGELFYYPSMQGGEYDASKYKLTNSWLWHREGGSAIALDAGHLRHDVDQGLMWFLFGNWQTSSRLYDIRNGVHLTPTKTGGLKITGADGSKVKLMSTSGVEWVFDAEQGRFISPVEEPLPTATPAPTPKPTPVILAVQRLSVDANVAGNSATAVGAIDSCAAVASGDKVGVDIVLEGLPLVGGSPIGIIAYDLKLVYDPKVLRVSGADTDQLLAAKPNSAVTSFGDSAPDSDGSLHLSVADFGVTGGDLTTISETTGGVLARITFEAIAGGQSQLKILEAGIIDTHNDAHAASTIQSAEIVVGAACG